MTSDNKKIHFEELKFNKFEKSFKSLKRNKAADFDDLSSSIIIYALRDLVSFVQFKKPEKYPLRCLTFSKFAG